MGEHAEAALYAEMMGGDPDDVTAEDYMAYYESLKPPAPNMIALDADMALSSIRQWGDEDSPPSVPELIESLFPKLTKEEAETVAKGLELLAAQYDDSAHDEDDEEDPE